MAETDCTLICTTCTRHEDAPLLLAGETADHELYGADYHETSGAVWVTRERHLERWPEHDLVVRCEQVASPGLARESARSLEDQAAARAAAVAELQYASIRTRLAQAAREIPSW